MIRRLQIRLLRTLRGLRKPRFLLGERTFITLLVLLLVFGIVIPFILKGLQTNQHANLGISVLVNKNYNCNDPSEAPYASIDAPESAGFGIADLPDEFERDEEKSINYGALSEGRLASQILYEKLDDLSLWNAIGAIIAGFFLLLAIRNAKHVTRVSWTGIILVVAIGSVSIWIYSIGLPGEPLIRLYGTLYCESPDPTIKLIQRLEGWNNVLFVIPLISAIAGWGLYLANRSRELAVSAKEPKKTARVLASLFNGPIWGIAAMLIGYFVLRYTLPYHDSRHCAHTPLFGLIFWHSPFWAMTVLASIRSLESETWKVTLSIHKVFDRIPVPCFQVQVFEPAEPVLKALRKIQKEAKDRKKSAEIEKTIQDLALLRDIEEQRQFIYSLLGSIYAQLNDRVSSGNLLKALKELEIISVHGPDIPVGRREKLERAIRNRKLQDFGDIIISWWRRSRQICLIKVNGNWQGTGFLVGADKVLTNYHVLFDTELGSTEEMNIELQNSEARITFEFDYVSFERSVSADRSNISLVTQSPVLCGSRVSGLDSTGNKFAALSTYPNDRNLDFVLLRIDRKVAEEEIVTIDGYHGTKTTKRGCVRLPPTEHQSYTDREITILQHPKGFKLSIAQGIVVEDSEARLRYAVSTDEGSSGSPCFLSEGSFPLIGLHHSSDPRFNRAEYNQAISAPAIMRFICSKTDPEVLEELSREQNALSSIDD